MIRYPPDIRDIPDIFLVTPLVPCIKIDYNINYLTYNITKH